MLNVNHEAPVESVLISPSGSLLFTAGELRVHSSCTCIRPIYVLNNNHIKLWRFNFYIVCCCFFSKGATEIRVWDCLAGGRLLSKISQHHKTITCLRFATNSKRLVSASLDRHVKIYDIASFEVVQTLDYTSPILSLGIAVRHLDVFCVTFLRILYRHQNFF